MNTWVNGRAAGGIDVRDRGLHYGDGVFETMRVRQSNIRLLQYHLERLLEGCRRLAILPPNVMKLRAELRRAAAHKPDAVLKLIVTRGTGARGYRPRGDERATRIMILYPLSRTAQRATMQSASVRLCATRIGDDPSLAGLKTLNRLDSVLARAEWADARIWEGLMRDSLGNIVCGTMSNLFVRRGVLLITPRLDRCGIAGVMRRWVLETASRLKLKTVEGRLRWSDLSRIDEAFMTNAVAGIVPVALIMHGRVRIRLSEHRTAHELSERLAAQ